MTFHTNRSHLRRLLLSAAAVLATTLVTLAPSAGAAPPSDPDGGPSVPDCLLETTASLTAVNRATFTQPVNLAWAVQSPCTTLTVRLAGEVVAKTGTKNVHPTTTTTYTLSAERAGATAPLARLTVVAGQVKEYHCSLFTPSAPIATCPLESYHGPNRDAAGQVGRRAFGYISEGHARNLLGKTIEYVVKPNGRNLPTLPEHGHLSGHSTWDGRPWETVPGQGGFVVGNRIVVTGPEFDFNPRFPGQIPIAAHELAHAVKTYAITDTRQRAAVSAARAAIVAKGVEDPWYLNMCFGQEIKQPDGTTLRYTCAHDEELWAEMAMLWLNPRTLTRAHFRDAFGTVYDSDDKDDKPDATFDELLEEVFPLYHRPN